jgi:hypothetical protein
LPWLDNAKRRASEALRPARVEPDPFAAPAAGIMPFV